MPLAFVCGFLAAPWPLMRLRPVRDRASFFSESNRDLSAFTHAQSRGELWVRSVGSGPDLTSRLL
eukprot:4638561-Heterocapsa_arctica.AAC.1